MDRGRGKTRGPLRLGLCQSPELEADASGPRLTMGHVLRVM